MSDERLPLDVRDAEMRLFGLIGLPELARPTAKYQHLYLNGRPIAAVSALGFGDELGIGQVRLRLERPRTA